MTVQLVRHTRVLEIVGDMLRVRASGAALGELALVENVDGEVSTAEVVGLDGVRAHLMPLGSLQGVHTGARVRTRAPRLEIPVGDYSLGPVAVRDVGGRPRVALVSRATRELILVDPLAPEGQRYFVYGNYIDEVLVMHRESDSEDYYYAHDHLYSVAGLIDDGGTPRPGQVLVAVASGYEGNEGLVVVQDAGKAVHPSYVEGQYQGGAVQGEATIRNEAPGTACASVISSRRPFCRSSSMENPARLPMIPANT